jgi:hypothetical protein
VRRVWAVLVLLVAGAWVTGGAQNLTLPNRPLSLKFAAIGDNGTGEVIMLGDNLYGSQAT